MRIYIFYINSHFLVGEGDVVGWVFTGWGPLWAVPWYSLQAVRGFVSLYVARRSVGCGCPSRTILLYPADGRQVGCYQTGALIYLGTDLRSGVKWIISSFEIMINIH